jgi:hypothetical protein
MDMSKGPIIIGLGRQVLDLARGIELVPFPTGCTRMEYPDVVEPLPGGGVVGGEIFRYIRAGKALPVQGDPNVSKRDGLRTGRGKSVDVVGHFEGFGYPARGIMVTGKIKDRDISFPESGHLAGKKKSCIIVIPVSIEEISRNHYEGHVFVDGCPDESFQGFSRSASNGIDGCPLIVIQPPKGAIEMDICSMNKLEHLSSPKGSYIRAGIPRLFLVSEKP